MCPRRTLMSWINEINSGQNGLWTFFSMFLCLMEIIIFEIGPVLSAAASSHKQAAVIPVGNVKVCPQKMFVVAIDMLKLLF